MESTRVPAGLKRNITIPLLLTEASAAQPAQNSADPQQPSEKGSGQGSSETQDDSAARPASDLKAYAEHRGLPDCTTACEHFYIGESGCADEPGLPSSGSSDWHTCSWQQYYDEDEGFWWSHDNGEFFIEKHCPANGWQRYRHEGRDWFFHEPTGRWFWGSSDTSSCSAAPHDLPLGLPEKHTHY